MNDQRRFKFTSARTILAPKAFYKGCQGKKKFPSKKVALGVARAMRDADINVYRCDFCKSYHLGHS